MEEEGFRSPEGQGAGVRPHLVVVGTENVKTLVFIHELGDVEVGNFEAEAGPLGRHQDVARLQVPVDDPVLVQVHHSAQQLSEEPLGDCL